MSTDNPDDHCMEPQTQASVDGWDESFAAIGTRSGAQPLADAPLTYHDLEHLRTRAALPQQFGCEVMVSTLVLNRVLARLAAASPVRPEPVAWQPITTIPEDGSHVLAYFPRHPFNDDDDMDEAVDLGGVIAVTFKSGNGWIEPDYLDASGAWYGDDFCYAPTPTLWMPLPATPTGDAGETPERFDPELMRERDEAGDTSQKGTTT